VLPLPSPVKGWGGAWGRSDRERPLAPGLLWRVPSSNTSPEARVLLAPGVLAASGPPGVVVTGVVDPGGDATGALVLVLVVEVEEGGAAAAGGAR
jgi:hypothetical protein